MKLGKRTPQRIEYYLKYKYSNIFGRNDSNNDDLSMSNSKSFTISQNKKHNIVFELKYDNVKSFQRYFKNFHQD